VTNVAAFVGVWIARSRIDRDTFNVYRIQGETRRVWIDGLQNRICCKHDHHTDQGVTDDLLATLD
jgi:hypothetical protein